MSKSLFMNHSKRLSAVTTLCILLLSGAPASASDPLPSWNDGKTKQAIQDFVHKVTHKGADFVAPEERIAVFDNDGTLWSEYPIYFQLAFSLDRVKAMAPEHPEWKTQQPFQAVLEGDMKTLAASGEKGMMQIAMTAHAGMSTEDFEQIVKDWTSTAKHPRFKHLYTELVYQPMLELLSYLRENGFKTYIVSGGGIEFMRPWVEKAYGIPPHQVIGSTIKTKYVFDGGVDGNWDGSKPPALMRLPEIHFIDDKEGKPVAINQVIGRRPIMAFGNSDGDKQMLEWTAAGKGARFLGLIRHTDAEREYAYDRESHIGKLDKALDEANARGWTVVDMKGDWKIIYPFEKKSR